MVIGYNPSHANVNSEVNAPFKILSLLLRFIDNELKPTNKRPLRPVIDEEETKEGGATGIFKGYQMQRQNDVKRKIVEAAPVEQDSGMRMDTQGGGSSEDD